MVPQRPRETSYRWGRKAHARGIIQRAKRRRWDPTTALRVWPVVQFLARSGSGVVKCWVLWGRVVSLEEPSSIVQSAQGPGGHGATWSGDSEGRQQRIATHSSRRQARLLARRTRHAAAGHLRQVLLAAAVAAHAGPSLAAVLPRDTADRLGSRDCAGVAQ